MTIEKLKIRAKSVNNEDWVYGEHYKDKAGHFIIDEITGSHIKIDKETLELIK